MSKLPKFLQCIISVLLAILLFPLFLYDLDEYAFRIIIALAITAICLYLAFAQFNKSNIPLAIVFVVFSLAIVAITILSILGKDIVDKVIAIIIGLGLSSLALINLEFSIF